MSNLVLTGFMGTGKTTIGRQVSRRLNMKFVDTDQEVEHVTGLTVREIFDKFGEIRFRSEEKAAVVRVCRNDEQVIATGGGVVLNPENIKELEKNGIIICLSASPEVIHQRTKNKKNRPILNTDDPLQTIRDRLAERKPLYEAAGVMVDTDNRSIEEVVTEVIRIYRECSARK